MAINALLLLTAFVLSVLFAPFGLVFAVAGAVATGSPRKAVGYLSALVLALAIGLDIFSNTLCRDLLNDTMRLPGGYAFGKQGETISRALGKNKETGTLSKAGIRLANLLDWIQKDHVEMAAMDNNLTK